MLSVTIGSLVAATEDVAEVVVGAGVAPVDIDSDGAADGAASVVATEEVANTTAGHGQADIAADVGLIGAAIHIINHIAVFHAAYTHVAGAAGSHVTAAVDFIDVYWAAAILFNIHADGATNGTGAVGSAKDSTYSAAVDVDAGVARYVGGCDSSIATAEDVAYLVATVNLYIGIAIGDMCSIATSINIFNTVVAVVYRNSWSAIAVVCLVAAAIDSK